MATNGHLKIHFRRTLPPTMISETVQTALIISIAPTIAAIAGLIASLRNSGKLKSLHLDINGRLSELLRANGEAERAKGHLEGVETERTRMPDGK